MIMSDLPPEVIERLKGFLREDIRSGDLTTSILGTHDRLGIGTFYSKSDSILAGVKEAAAIAEIMGLDHEILATEGEWVKPKQPVMRIKGLASLILQVERVCLNIIMRMSGAATKAHKMQAMAQKHNPDVRVAATRKTTPGFRFFEKRAVQIGGADPHRYALDDMILIKNNHITVVGSAEEAVRLARKKVSFSKKISCEVRDVEECISAVKAGADIVLLDNFTPEDVSNANAALEEVGLRDRVILEVSGGVDEENVEEFGKLEVDILSSGALTHSYTAADFNMLLEIKKK
jgi:nicotinate-nucleotide pyrophosphorylase (carboxylating)